MKKTILVLLVCVFATSLLVAQEPLLKRVWVDLPYAVQVNDKTLEPGQYVFEEPRSASTGNLYLNIYQGTKEVAKASAQTFAAEKTDASTPKHSALTISHLGNGYYLDKLWVQGEDVGYQFSLPSGVKAAEKERAESIDVPISTHGK